MLNGFPEHYVFQLFAALVDYPKMGLGALAREAGALVAASSPDAARLLAAFANFADEIPLGRLEEIYTGVFELNALCHPYVGYHLFGETYKRSVFLLGLKERYAVQDFAVEPELPDHLTAMLRFLSVCDDLDTMDECVADALLPALEKMIAPDSAGEPASEASAAYCGLLQALQLVLQKRCSRISETLDLCRA
jgi:nitrate reductase delta subunit